MTALWPCVWEWSQEKKCDQNQEKNLRQSQEKNFNYRLSQEKKWEQRRFDFAGAEDAVRRALGFDGDSNRCPLPGHYGGVASLELRAKPGHEFVCDCLGSAAVWGDDNVWRSDYERSLSDAYESVRTGRVIERGSKLPKGERFVASLLLAHEIGMLQPIPVGLPVLPPGVPELHLRAWDFFRLLAGLRLAWMKPEDALPMPFAERLVGAYLHVDRRLARAAITGLTDRQTIENVGRASTRGPYRFVPAQRGGQPT